MQKEKQNWTKHKWVTGRSTGWILTVQIFPKNKRSGQTKGTKGLLASPNQPLVFHPTTVLGHPYASGHGFILSKTWIFALKKNNLLKCHSGNKIMIEYECPGFCPVECGQDQILCRHVDDKGCEQPGGCIPAMSKMWKIK